MMAFTMFTIIILVSFYRLLEYNKKPLLNMLNKKFDIFCHVTGENELIFMKKLLTRFMNIEACVLEPCRDLIFKYQDLVDENEKELEGVEYEWRQQSLEEYGQTCQYFGEGPKYHFISLIHSIYYVNELESALKLLHGMLEPGGALLITIVTGGLNISLISLCLGIRKVDFLKLFSMSAGLTGQSDHQST